MNSVVVNNLSVSYREKRVLTNVNLELPVGKTIAIVGPNGAGKSTLLKSILELIPVESGQIKILGKDLEEIRNKISYVPQRESVDWDFPASVMDIVLMGRYKRSGLFNRITKADRVVAEDALRKVGMEAFSKRQISQLSGGQQQRVFLARALAQQADLYFMDEPFAGVDATTEKAILELFQEMSSKGQTIIAVHHDLQSVADFFDWVIVLNKRIFSSGQIPDALDPKLLQQAYGGSLTLLSEIENIAEKSQYLERE